MAVIQQGAAKPAAVQQTAAQKAPSDPTKQVNAMQAAAPFRIQPLGERTRYLNMLVYGAHGSGKTTLAASSADVEQMQYVLLVNAESGEMTIEDNDRIKHPEFIHEVRITTFDQAAHVLDFLRAHCKARDAGNIEALKRLQARFFGQKVEDIDEPFLYRTVVVDSLYEIDQYCIYGIMKIDTDDFKLDGNAADEVAGWPEFRKNNQKMQILMRAYRDLPMNTILVCPASYNQDEKKVFHWTPALTGQLSRQVQGFMDIVCYIVTGALQEGQTEAPRRLYLQPVGKFDAKNRRASFKKSFVDNPTMSSLMEEMGLIRG